MWKWIAMAYFKVLSLWLVTNFWIHCFHNTNPSISASKCFRDSCNGVCN